MNNKNEGTGSGGGLSLKCNPNDHLYIPITWDSYAEGTHAIQKALAVMCEKCLDIKYITETKITIKPVETPIPTTDISKKN